MKLRFICGSICAFVFLITTVGYSECNYDYKSAVIQEMIDLIKMRLNILSLKCKYTAFLFKTKETGEDEIWDMVDLDFAYQEGNCVRSVIVNRNSYKIDTSHNLLELFARKFSPGSGGESGPSMEYYYYYNGRFYYRDSSELSDDKDIVRIGNRHYLDGFGPRPDPRWVMGYFGTCLSSNNGEGPFRKISEFLDYPGPYDYSEKDGYRILWHSATYHDLPIEIEGTDTEDVDLEIWVDSKGYIVRLQEGAFWTRRYGYDYVKKVLGEGYEISCEFPVSIRKVYEFYNIQEFDNGAQLPLKGVFYRYYNNDPSRSRDIYKEYREGKINEIEADIKLGSCPLLRRKGHEELIIQPEGLSANEPIPEETFVPPKLSLERYFKTDEEMREYYDNKRNAEIEKMRGTSQKEGLNIPPRAIVFAGVGVLIVLVLMYLTHRYLGWSFF